MLIDREVVDVDQQLLDKTGNSLGIEYFICHKLLRIIIFVGKYFGCITRQNTARRYPEEIGFQISQCLPLG